MPTLEETLRSAPTTRSFRADPIPDEVLERALALARLAAGRSWPVVAVTDAATRRAIRDAWLPHWHAHLVQTGGTRIIADDAPANVARMLRQADLFAQRLDEVPVHLVVAGAGGAAEAFTDHLLRALCGEGLAAARVTEATRAEDELRALLDLPATVAVGALIAVGHRPAPGLRRPSAGALHRDRWGAAA